MSEEILRATNGGLVLEDKIFTVCFHDDSEQIRQEEEQKTLQNANTRPRKVKHPMRRESLWCYLNFSKNILMEKNPVLLEVQLSHYHNCNELYIARNVQQKLGLIAVLKHTL